MTRYKHLAETEHIFSMTDREVRYLRKALIAMRPLCITNSDKHDNAAIFASCNLLLNGK